MGSAPRVSLPWNSHGNRNRHPGESGVKRAKTRQKPVEAPWEHRRQGPGQRPRIRCDSAVQGLCFARTAPGMPGSGSSPGGPAHSVAARASASQGPSFSRQRGQIWGAAKPSRPRISVTRPAHGRRPAGRLPVRCSLQSALSAAPRRSSPWAALSVMRTVLAYRPGAAKRKVRVRAPRPQDGRKRVARKCPPEYPPQLFPPRPQKSVILPSSHVLPLAILVTQRYDIIKQLCLSYQTGGKNKSPWGTFVN
jgi:hypothetical protein